MQLTLPVAQVLDEANAQAHQLAQLFGGLVARRDGGRPLDRGEACDSDRVDGVGVRAPQVLLGEAPTAQRVDDRDGEAPARQRALEVLAVMPGGLHHDEAVRDFTEEFPQLVVSSRVFAKGRGLEQNVKALVHHRHDVILRANVDAEVTHLIL